METAELLLTGRGLALPLVAFLLLALATYATATRLAARADAIAEATGLGRLFVGTLLLAASTSLPELATDVDAALLGRVDLGVGDLLGSTLANLLILATADLAWRHRRVLYDAAPDHALVGVLAMVLTALAGAAVASGGGWLRIGHVGLETVAIVALYAAGLRVVYATRSDAPAAAAGGDDTGSPPAPSDRRDLRPAVTGFAVATVALLAIAPLLVIAAGAVASESGAGETLVGTVLVGFTTSFPELAATVAAIRLGARDLAVGNVFGSCAFNMCVLAAMDLAYLPGPVLAAASPQHAVTALFAVLAVGLGVLAVAHRGRARFRGPPFESVLIVLVYVLAVAVLARGR